MNEHSLFLLQLLGAVSVGGFVGEFYRTSTNTNISARIFLGKFLSGAFLSFIMALITFYVIEKRPFALLLGALLSYQDENFLEGLSRKLLDQWITKER